METTMVYTELRFQGIVGYTGLRVQLLVIRCQDLSGVHNSHDHTSSSSGPSAFFLLGFQYGQPCELPRDTDPISGEVFRFKVDLAGACTLPPS